MLALDIDHVSHRYGEHVALCDFSVEVSTGTLFGLVGPNGSGKTTLLRILSTLMPPTEGKAAVFGHDTQDEPTAVRQRLGVVFQEPALDHRLTVEENLRACGALFGLSGAPLRERIQELLQRFGLAGRSADYVQVLSGGLRRRVDLTRSLLHRPDVLLLDEPTSGLDPGARHLFWDHLDRLRDRKDTTLLVATHLMEEAERCDQVAILDRGRCVSLGAPRALKRALGDQTLWLKTSEPEALRRRLHAQWGLEAQQVGATMLHLASSRAPDLLPSLYKTFGDKIDSATVREPTLEDVFMAYAGHRPAPEATSEETPAPRVSSLTP